MVRTSSGERTVLGVRCRILAIWMRPRSGAGRAGPTQPPIERQVGARTLPTMQVAAQ